MDYPFGEPSVIKDSLTTEPNSPKNLDSSIEPMRDAFEADMVKRYREERASFARNENRYFDSSMEIAWQAFQAGAKYQSSPLAPSPCMDGLQVGDAVRFVWPGHERHGTEGIVFSEVDLVSSGLNYWFESNCGKFSCYCSASQLERIDQPDPVNPSHYKHLPAEAIDIIEAAIAGAPSNQYAFLQGQVLKYLLRCWSKKGIEDLRKAKWYLDRLIGGFDDLLAEASGANDGPAVKRYREPKLSDLANGPIVCECRGGQLHEWQPQMLLDILREAGHPYRASCPKNQHKITRWSQCRIEVSE
jgi:hypothetical protein